VFVLKLVVTGIFRKNGRLKFKSLKSGALLYQGPQHCFIDDSHPSLCTVFLPTPVEIFIYTHPAPCLPSTPRNFIIRTGPYGRTWWNALI